MGELTDEEMENIIEEEIKKDIDQSSSIDEKQVEAHLGEMGFLWDSVHNKLDKDATCFKCKKEVDFSGGKMHLLVASGTEKGVAAFVSLCKDCHTTLEKENNMTKADD